MNQYAPNPNRGQGEAIRWIERHVGYADEVCLIWPFAKSVQRGYGRFSHNGVSHYAHRYMCELVNGLAPSPRHQASHTCGKGHKGCVNPRHLAWATNSENQRDRRRHGTAAVRGGPGAKMTAPQIAHARSLRDVLTIEEIAAKFGVKRGTIEYWLKRDDEPQRQGGLKVMAVLEASPVPMRIRDIVQAAQLADLNAGYRVVARLARVGRIERCRRGRYGPLGKFTSEQEPKP